MSRVVTRTPLGRAQDVNQNALMYGTFAEIGAGQEVARYFFQAGRASQTIAKTISAYDMTFSDEIYGKETGGRYVCESRLNKMLEKEFGLLNRRLGTTRAAEKRFFAYANTVATGDLTLNKKPHGWMGIRFQSKPKGPHNDIILHLQLLDRHRLMQQDALGVLGVNLVSLATFNFADPKTFVESLTENIKPGQVSIDMVQLQGEDLKGHNPALINLELVRKGLSSAILFSPEMKILNPGDAFFRQALVLERGHFRPITNSHLDVMEKGIEQFKTEFGKSTKPLPVFEISMHSLDESAEEQDFLDRVHGLTALGFHVLVSKFFLFHQLKNYLRSVTSEPIAMLIGANLLDRLFEEKHYKDLDGGLLEGLGRLMDDDTKVLVYPSKTDSSCSTLKTFFGSKKSASLVEYFKSQKWLVEMSNCEDIDVFINSNQILEMIDQKKADWKKLVPAAIAKQIETGNLFGYRKKGKA